MAEAFRRDPKLVWQWYAWRRARAEAAQPNRGHCAIALMAKLVPRFTLITQNVDGLHQRAGSTDVLELHGNIRRVKCFAENVVVDDWRESRDAPPRCPRCRDWLRPDVVWFGEMLPKAALEAAHVAAAECQVFLSVGTSTLVYPAAELPFVALNAGATVVEVNPNPTPLTEAAHFSLRGSSARVLPEIVQTAWGVDVTAPGSDI